MLSVPICGMGFIPPSMPPKMRMLLQGVCRPINMGESMTIYLTIARPCGGLFLRLSPADARPAACCADARGDTRMDVAEHQRRGSAGAAEYCAARDCIPVAPCHTANEQCEILGAKHRPSNRPLTGPTKIKSEL